MTFNKKQLRQIIKEELRSEGLFGGSESAIKAVMKKLNDSLSILEREGYDEAYDHVVSAIEALEYPEGNMEENRKK